MNFEYTGNWAFSSLLDYEARPMRFRLKRIDKIPEPPRPPDNPLERGTRIHDHLDAYTAGRVDSLDGIEAKRIAPFVPMLDHLRELRECGMATGERDWLFDRDWNVTQKDWGPAEDRGDIPPGMKSSGKPIWLWAKLDVSVCSPAQSLVITGDYKSGKSAYKTIEHIQQTQLYAAVSALRYDWADHHSTELYYVDEGWTKPVTYTREQALAFVGRFDQRAQRIYDDRYFRPNPSKVTCKWCPHSPRGTGACPVGV